MPPDKPFRVAWKAGEIIVHAATEARAVEIAVEYLRVPDAQRLNATIITAEIVECQS